MIEFLILILVVCVTYLVADFRRWLEIQSINASHEAEIDQVFDSAFDAGYDWGDMLGRIEEKYGFTLPTQ